MRVLHRSRRRFATAAAAVALVGLAACGGGGAAGGETGAAAGSLAASVDLSGVKISVGSKEFTEQKILGRIMVQVLEAAGAEVTDQTGLTGTPVVRQALESGDIGAYYEYTGTGWINILQQTTPVPGEEAQFNAVRDADAENGVTWLAPASANNTYAIAANEAISQKYSPKTISDFARISQEHPDEAGLCTATEFVTRDDGLPGMEKVYGFTVPEDRIAVLDFGLVYASVAKGDPCNFAVVFGTDGQILANKLTILEDDKSYFPLYNIAVSMRTDIYDAHSDAYDKLFGDLSAFLTNENMTELNAAVDVEGRDIESVVEEFLKTNNII